MWVEDPINLKMNTRTQNTIKSQKPRQYNMIYNNMVLTFDFSQVIIEDNIPQSKKLDDREKYWLKKWSTCTRIQHC